MFEFASVRVKNFFSGVTIECLWMSVSFGSEVQEVHGSTLLCSHET